MSVILDALHKARGDRRKPAADQPHEQTVARVVDAGLAPQNAYAPDSPRPGGRTWLIAMGVICGLICLVALIGGAFFLLYDQMRRIETVATQPAQASPAIASPAPAAVQIPVPPIVTPAAVLQTPVPLTELPVQPPAASAAAATTAEPDFNLGSIVCENNDCIASLNGRSVRVGETIKGYNVISIDSTGITLKSEAGGKEITLSLFD